LSGGGNLTAKEGLMVVEGSSDKNGLQLVDIANPSSPQIRSTITYDVITAKALRLSANRLFAGGSIGQPRLAIFDISDPSSPTILGHFDFDVASSSGASVFSLAVYGGVAVAGIVPFVGENDIVLLDITDPTNIKRGGHISGLEIPMGIEISPDGHYAYALVGSSDTTIKVLNITDTANPRVESTIPVDSSFARVLKLSGNDLYVGSFRNVHVFDISNPSSPHLSRSYPCVGVTDIALPDQFGDLSQSVVLSDMEGGLTILHRQDIQSPSIFITNPTFDQEFTTSQASINIGGGAQDDVGLMQITWSNSRGGSGEADGLGDWSALGIPLQPGTNTITVAAHDASGNIGFDTLSVLYEAPKQEQFVVFPDIAAQTYGTSPLSLLASASSGLPVRYAVLSGPASVEGDVLTIHGSGTVIVQATQDGDEFFEAASAVRRQFIVNKADQAITFPPLSSVFANETKIAVSASANSLLKVRLEVLSGPATVNSEGGLDILGGGIVRLRASQLGDANYNAAIPVEREFNVLKLKQTISFGPFNVQFLGDAPFALGGLSSSHLPVTVTVTSGPATISAENVLSITGFGTIVLVASQAGDAVYYPAIEVTRTITVLPRNNVIGGIQFTKNGPIMFRFYGQADHTAVVERSGDLRHWTPVTTNRTGLSGYFDFSWPMSFSNEMFRVQLQ
jgi:hypothetical protein